MKKILCDNFTVNIIDKLIKEKNQFGKKKNHEKIMWKKTKNTKTHWNKKKKEKKKWKNPIEENTSKILINAYPVNDIRENIWYDFIADF